MKILKNKTILGVIAIIFAIAVSFILTPLYNKSLENKVRVVQVVKTIPKGGQISADDVKEIEVGSYNLPEAVIKNTNNVVGMYSTTDLYKEDFILPDKLSSSPLSNNDYLENLDGIYGAMSVTLQSFASGLSGKLQGGDIVSIISTDSDNNTAILPELRYVKVLSSTTAEGTDVVPGTIKTESNNNDNIPTTVTLLVNEQQSKALANLEASEKVHISLVYRGDEELCKQYLERQGTVLEQIKIAEEKTEIIETDRHDENVEYDESTEEDGDYNE